MCTCLNLLKAFYTVKQTLCSGIPSSVELLLGTTVELFLTRQLVFMGDSVYFDTQFATDKLIDVKEAECTASVSINKLSIVL